VPAQDHSRGAPVVFRPAGSNIRFLLVVAREARALPCAFVAVWRAAAGGRNAAGGRARGGNVTAVQGGWRYPPISLS
jgi:hypothetical protein